MSAARRKVTAYGRERIEITGLTLGPVSGWRLVGDTLLHPLGIEIALTPGAAERVAAAAARTRRGTYTELTGPQIDLLPEPDRTRWREAVKHLPLGGEPPTGYGYRCYLKEGAVVVYTLRTRPTPGHCEFRTDEVVRVRTSPRTPDVTPRRAER